MSSIQRLLIANRGEIACRVIRTAQELGMETVAVYSEADADALHVQLADQALPIGPAAAQESYLSIERVIDAARQSGSDAIHPGYGFLSENARFAEACGAADITFVGPSPSAIDLMGDKARAKRAMIDAGVPCIPGYQGEDQSVAKLTTEATQIGYPLMIKAAAGGGGRGMRLVHEAKQLETALETARSEAVNAFGNGDLILEKAIQYPRHVEVQVFGDQHGNIVYLGERDCSVQRRHQKVVEEAPCPVMTPELRMAMGTAAVAAARAVDYVGAGTVEFLLDANGDFYFLEMNTRLQVEHPVTELITGMDLVALQLQVAGGEALGFTQADVALNGHAMEVRLYAEDPRNDFLPSTGRIALWVAPTGSDIRVDAGVVSGSDVSSFYDPMVAKVIAHGRTRDQARRKLIQALSNSLLVGPATNRDFLIDALSRQSFKQGQATTAFIEDEYGTAGFSLSPNTHDLAIAAVVQYTLRAKCARDESLGVNDELINWSSSVRLDAVSVYRLGEDLLTFIVCPTNAHTYVVRCGDTYEASFKVLGETAHQITFECNGTRQSVAFLATNNNLTLHLATSNLEFCVQDVAAGEAILDGSGSGQVLAPMHGQLLELFVSEGDTVSKGQRLALLEAMKMQHEILAEVDGTVTAIHAATNTQIAMDALILEIEAV